MVRKYLDRKDKTDSEDYITSKNEQSKKESIENIDPLNAEERTLVLTNQEPKLKNISTENATEQINKAEQYMQYINSQLADRLLRIEKIKQSHENFEREIELLQTEKNKQIKKTRISDELVNEPESVKATRELSNLIQQYAVEKLEMMKKLFDSEKKQSTELNTKLQENLNKITISEERLKQQRENLEIEIRDKTNKLIQAERLSAIGEISARLAHDLRNPLTVIKGTVEIIKAKNKKIDTEFSSKQIEMMERAVSRMSNQIDEVLDFVKIQTLHATKNSLFETIGLSITKIKKSADFSINVVGNNVRFVYDADKLEVVLDNVITNAVEAINEKGQIDIRVNDNSNEIVIEIEDSGTGVPEELLTKIFEPLFTTKQRGTGLGLASCKRIIEQHGGSIHVKSKPSMFIIKLPKLLEISMF
jgi:two-component system sensor histidine kinase HydH